MRALFYIGDRQWSASARVFLAAARGLVARGHQVTIACPSGTPIVERIAGNDVETVLVEADANVASAGWSLRRTLQERFVEVAFVQSERDQFVVSSAMRFADRGAVIRRVPAFGPVDVSGDMISRRLASAGLLLTSEVELARLPANPWPIPPAVAPIGVNAQSYDAVKPADRASIAERPGATIIVCPYDPTGRTRIATVMRALALLATRHPELHLVVIGPGSRDEELRIHTAAVGVTALVSFLPEAEDALAVLRAADLVWVCSGNDAGAYAFLDAMSLRQPVVAERSPLSETYIADGLSGVLLGSVDPPLVASAIAALLAHPDRRLAIANAGRARVQREFSEDAMIDGFERAGAAACDRTKWAR